MSEFYHTCVLALKVKKVLDPAVGAGMVWYISFIKENLRFSPKFPTEKVWVGEERIWQDGTLFWFNRFSQKNLTLQRRKGEFSNYL